jgi:hypothetical protein
MLGKAILKKHPLQINLTTQKVKEYFEMRQ